jgi:ketosteroid isomerase-like protein
VEELEVAGDWAFAWGSETVTLVAQTGGSPIHMQGKGMSILKRQPDGSWKIARGINNTVLGARV